MTRKAHHRIFIAVAILALAISFPFVARPSATDLRRELFRGVVYERRALTIPRRMMVHIASIDLGVPGVKLFITPGEPQLEVRARTTSAFLSEFKLQLAINGGHFAPFYDRWIFDYAPHGGDAVNIHGQVISNGTEYSPPQDGWPVFCFRSDAPAALPFSCPPGTTHGLSGSAVLIHGAIPMSFQSGTTQAVPAPRAGLGTDAEGKRLWLVAVDGRQPYYSDGATSNDLVEIFSSLGATEALELDGGGSVTMAADRGWWNKVLNSPIHSRIPLLERPVGNHFGVYAEPLEK